MDPGSAVSSVLANLFMHYAFDMWLEREFPTVTFERYADDQDGKHQSSYEHTEFTFLGYTFRARKSQDERGRRFLPFEPAISKDALKRPRAGTCRPPRSPGA